jgi:hypothetical protein
VPQLCGLPCHRSPHSAGSRCGEGVVSCLLAGTEVAEGAGVGGEGVVSYLLAGTEVAEGGRSFSFSSHLIDTASASFI